MAAGVLRLGKHFHFLPLVGNQNICWSDAVFVMPKTTANLDLGRYISSLTTLYKHVVINPITKHTAQTKTTKIITRVYKIKLKVEDK